MTMIALDSNYVRVIDQVFDSQFCQHLIEEFELCREFHKETPGKMIELDCFNTTHNPKAWLPKSVKSTYDWTADTTHIIDVIKPLAQAYRDTWDQHNCLPLKYSAEGIRIKCYRPGVHEFKMHVDQGTRESASRFMAFLIYLNDSEAGTEFPLENMTVEARQGRLLIFPPNWQYPHRGLMPLTDTKYIMSTYLHYIPQDDY
jgi:hypothetical protein